MADDAKTPPAGGGSQSRGATPGQDPGQTTQPVESANLLVPSERPPLEVQQQRQDDDGDFTAGDEAELVRLQAKAQRAAAGPGGTVEVKVEGPHSEMRYGGTVVGSDWTEVPETAVAGLETAAAGAGVKLTRKEEG